jgi:hypothetical protein
MLSLPSRSPLMATALAAVLLAGPPAFVRAPGWPGIALDTVALAPVAIPEELPDSSRAQAAFEVLLTAELQSLGITVVPARKAGATWQRLLDSVGGFYSAYTGEVDAAKYHAVRNGTLRELHARFGADALLRSRIGIVTVNWTNGNAKWDGTSEGIGGGASGTLPALTLFVELDDPNGNVVYTGRGGIQVMMKTSLLHRDQLHDLDPAKLLTDEGRNRNAVRLALDPLGPVVTRSRSP